MQNGRWIRQSHEKRLRSTCTLLHCCPIASLVRRRHRPSWRQNLLTVATKSRHPWLHQVQLQIARTVGELWSLLLGRAAPPVEVPHVSSGRANVRQRTESSAAEHCVDRSLAQVPVTRPQQSEGPVHWIDCAAACLVQQQPEQSCTNPARQPSLCTLSSPAKIHKFKFSYEIIISLSFMCESFTTKVLK